MSPRAEILTWKNHGERLRLQRSAYEKIINILSGLVNKEKIHIRGLLVDVCDGEITVHPLPDSGVPKELTVLSGSQFTGFRRKLQMRGLLGLNTATADWGYPIGKRSYGCYEIREGGRGREQVRNCLNRTLEGNNLGNGAVFYVSGVHEEVGIILNMVTPKNYPILLRGLERAGG